MLHMHVIKKETHNDIDEEPFEENLKPLLRFGSIISVQLQEDYGEISALSSGDISEYHEEIEHFRFDIKFKDRFFKFMEDSGRHMSTRDQINYKFSPFKRRSPKSKQ